MAYINGKTVSIVEMNGSTNAMSVRKQRKKLKSHTLAMIIQYTMSSLRTIIDIMARSVVSVENYYKQDKEEV